MYLKLAFVTVAVLYFRSLTRTKTTYKIFVSSRMFQEELKDQRGNPNLYIEDEQTIQWPREKVQREQARIYKTYTSN